MSINKVSFGQTKNGEEVFEYILDNEKGLCARILTFGGIIKNLLVTDKNGEKTDVVLGRDTIEEYEDNDGYLGALIGRNGNRIENAEFELGGEKYTLAKNDGENNLHGGNAGFDKKVWGSNAYEENGDIKLVLTTVSPDGEEGFPGTLNVVVTYTITKDCTLRINYRAVSDKDTVVNMTNHSYFNMGGDKSGVIYDQEFYLNSSFYTPNNDGCAPTGEILSVEGTPFDFRCPKPIGADINADYEQIKMFGGYDHNFVIDGDGMREGGYLKSHQTGIKMTMTTDCPGVQIYSANCLGSDRVCKDGAVYANHYAVCLETQAFPNAMKYKHFPSTVLKAGQLYNTTTEYKFTIEK